MENRPRCELCGNTARGLLCGRHREQPAASLARQVTRAIHDKMSPPGSFGPTPPSCVGSAGRSTDGPVGGPRTSAASEKRPSGARVSGRPTVRGGGATRSVPLGPTNPVQDNKTPPRTQSDDYRLGWEEALDAAIDAARDVVAAAAPTPPANQRADVLLWAADRYETILASAAAQHSSDPRYYTGVRDVILGLRRLAAGAQQTPAPARTTVLLEAADAIDTETQRLKDDGVLEPDRYRPCRDASAQLRTMAAGAQQDPAPDGPRRGDPVEQWLKAQRDAAADHPAAYQAADGLLDLYRLHADTGTPLDDHVCEGRMVGNCEGLEQDGAQQ
jgi:hypothetical protein